MRYDWIVRIRSRGNGRNVTVIMFTSVEEKKNRDVLDVLTPLVIIIIILYLYSAYYSVDSKRLWHSFLICATLINLRPLGAILARRR